MVITRRLDKPSLFITFITNPLWPEIQYKLLSNQDVDNCRDLICRVFQMKQKKLLEDLK